MSFLLQLLLKEFGLSWESFTVQNAYFERPSDWLDGLCSKSLLWSPAAILNNPCLLVARSALAAGQKGELTWEILSTVINPAVLVPSFSQQYAKVKVDPKVNSHVGHDFDQEFKF